MNNRKMKKLGSRDESGISQQSVLSAMDRFVHAVDNMNETVMIPSRLMDMTIFDDAMNIVPPSVSSADLYSFYNMLNAVKNELIWGGAGNKPVQQEQRTTPSRTTSVESSHAITAISRRNSTVSSMSLSDSEADTDTCSESDSSLEYVDDTSSCAARNFRHHLNGLYQALQQLTDSADVLTGRYQDEVGGSS